jgi:agarase
MCYLAAMRWIAFALLALLGACNAPVDESDPCVALEGNPELDAWGGDSRVSLEATGWFRTEKVCDRWWLVTPDGHPFYSTGVNSVRTAGDRNAVTGEHAYRETVDANYQSEEEWAEVVAGRLREWGFNTIGAWSDTELFLGQMPVTPILGLAGDNWLTGEVADYFDPAWQAEVEAMVADEVSPRADDPWVVGWLIDNEIRWGSDWRSQDTYLQQTLGLPADAPGKQVAVDLLLEELGGLDGVNAFLGTEHPSEEALLAATGGWGALDWDREEADPLTARFLEEAAGAYFGTTATAIRSVDPNHLVLGNREVSVLTRAEVYLAAAPLVDVITINNYVFRDRVDEAAMNLSGSLDPADGFAALHELVDLPILITEFGFRAADAGLPNSWPPIYPTYADQEARADAFEDYARAQHGVPWIVGYHWFQHADQPVDGRFDGEDNNWGLVSEQDEPYSALTERMAEVNPAIWVEVRNGP